jgi:hypothetical protein
MSGTDNDRPLVQGENAGDIARKSQGKRKVRWLVAPAAAVGGGVAGGLAYFGANAIGLNSDSFLALSTIGSFVATAGLAGFAGLTLRENSKLIAATEALATSAEDQLTLQRKQDEDDRFRERMSFLQDSAELIEPSMEILR